MRKLLTLVALMFVLGLMTSCKKDESGAQEQPQQKMEEQTPATGDQQGTAEQPASESEGAAGEAEGTTEGK